MSRWKKPLFSAIFSGYFDILELFEPASSHGVPVIFLASFWTNLLQASSPLQGAQSPPTTRHVKDIHLILDNSYTGYVWRALGKSTSTSHVGGVSKNGKEDERRRKLNIVKFTGSYFLCVCVCCTLANTEQSYLLHASQPAWDSTRRLLFPTTTPITHQT